VAKLQAALQKYQARLTAFQSQRETLKAQYTANKAVSQAGESLAGIGEHINDTSMMITRAQDKIAGMQAHADAVDSLLDSGVLDGPGFGTSTLDSQLQVTVMENDVQAKLAALKAQAKLPAPATAGAPQLGGAGIVIRIHGEGQYRLDPSLRESLDTYDHQLVSAVKGGDDAAYHAALGELFTFVRGKGMRHRAAQRRHGPRRGHRPARQGGLAGAEERLMFRGFPCGAQRCMVREHPHGRAIHRARSHQHTRPHPAVHRIHAGVDRGQAGGGRRCQ
jgi:hypothetical protein